MSELVTFESAIRCTNCKRIVDPIVACTTSMCPMCGVKPELVFHPGMVIPPDLLMKTESVTLRVVETYNDAGTFHFTKTVVVDTPQPTPTPNPRRSWWQRMRGET